MGSPAPPPPPSALDLEKHRLALMAARGDVGRGGRGGAAGSWALFVYEKSNALKLLDSGAGGPDELARRFQNGSVMYGLCRLSDEATGQPHIVLIHWVGENVSDQRQQVCAGHLPAIRAFFKEANLVVKASKAEEVTQQELARMLSQAGPPGGALTKKGPPRDPEELVGTNYRKTNPALEILHTKRSSFWAQAEREEEERREEERRKAQEERRRWERQRMEEERRQAAERERRVQEKEQLVQEQRKLQAQREAEERQNEEARRQREVAALASQHSHNPRDFFQQRERSGSASEQPSFSPGGQPGAPRRPFLRHQRSLTESAYIFRRPDPPYSPSSSSGGFLPSDSPPEAAPLPCPRRAKPLSPISPKPGPGAPETKALSIAVPPETQTLPLPALRTAGSTRGGGPIAAAVATTLEEGGGLQSLTLLEGGGGGGEGPPELGPPSAGARGPSSSLAPGPPPCSLTQARPLTPPHSLADAPQVGPVPPWLGGCNKKALPHTGIPSPPSSWSPDSRGAPRPTEGEGGGQPRGSPAAPPPTNGFLQEEGSATDDPPGLSQGELAPSSSGDTGEGQCLTGHELGMGGQVDSPVGTEPPGATLRDSGAGEWKQNGDQPLPAELRGHTVGPSVQEAEA